MGANEHDHSDFNVGPARHTPTGVYLRKQRAFRTAMRAMTVLTASAHPETGGDHLCVHNWGNAEARRLTTNGWARWRRYDDASRLAYARAQHREHEERAEAGRYLWCEACRGVAASTQRRRVAA